MRIIPRSLLIVLQNGPRLIDLFRSRRRFLLIVEVAICSMQATQTTSDMS